jgi:hypothetical protein
MSTRHSRSSGDGEVRDAALLVVRHRAAELLLGDVLVRDRPDHVGAGHEHVARVFTMMVKSVIAGE